MAQYDDLNITKIAVVGVISVVVTAVTALAVQVMFYAMADRIDTAKIADSEYTRQNAVLAEQTAEISSYGANPDNAKVTIPVEKAMEKMAAEAKKADKDA